MSANNGGAMTLNDRLLCEVYDAYNEHDRTMAPWAEAIRKHAMAMRIKAAADARLKKRLEAVHRRHEREKRREEKRAKKAAGTYEDTDDFDET